MMKTKKIIYYILMFLPLIVTVIALGYLPDQIPAHYGYNNAVTRWGSKYESLLFPAMTLFFGWFMLAMSKYSAKQEAHGRNNEKICVITGIVSLLLFNVMTYYFLYTDYQKIENLSSVPLDLYQVLFGVLGIIMIITGNVMPKLRMNSLIGLRTKWSMKNETTWKKSQFFGGISFIVAGIFTIIVCLLTKDVTCFLWTMAIMTVLLVIDTYYTYKIAQKY